MKIAIVAAENDNHTAPVKWALEKAGYTAFCWAGLGWTPERQASVALPESMSMRLGPGTLDPGDVVWIRRPEPPCMNPNVAEADRKFARGEYHWFSESLMYLLEMLPVRCVNRYSASRMVRNKSVQLLLAHGCGMNVPATLMSNAPLEVRRYLHQQSSRAICKAFFPHIWRKEAERAVAVTETFELTEDMLPKDEVLTYAPAIYQELVIKEFDVRMQLLGTAVYSFALHNPKGSIDWRQDVTQGGVRVESIATPEAIRQQVLEFARKSGIVFGSFDFAVDREGGWWFLEVNEEGQFLWLDEFNPHMHVQEKFLAFLTSPEGATPDVIESRQSLFPSWKEYLDSPETDQPSEEQPRDLPEFMSVE
jgi:glutathione synthase/RimK-type ligase-like ATP-grasp enzyme